MIYKKSLMVVATIFSLIALGGCSNSQKKSASNVQHTTKSNHKSNDDGLDKEQLKMISDSKSNASKLAKAINDKPVNFEVYYPDDEMSAVVVDRSDYEPKQKEFVGSFTEDTTKYIQPAPEKKSTINEFISANSFNQAQANTLNEMFLPALLTDDKYRPDPDNNDIIDRKELWSKFDYMYINLTNAKIKKLNNNSGLGYKISATQTIKYKLKGQAEKTITKVVTSAVSDSKDKFHANKKE